jgi:hypothetical protein
MSWRWRDLRDGNQDKLVYVDDRLRLQVFYISWIADGSIFTTAKGVPSNSGAGISMIYKINTNE